MKIILASASERRQELLKRITEDFQIVVSNFDEKSVNYEGSCSSHVMTLAEKKALQVVEQINSPKLNPCEETIVIGCDTVVFFNGRVLEKPKDEEDAFQMLKSLSGEIHEVYSGLALINTKSGEIKKDYISTQVKFSKLQDNEIRKYINTSEPMDKAGAYGIQGYGGVFVEEIHGCYYNVVGLPLNKLNLMFREMGVYLGTIK